jgi:signal transduction histidine kinase
MAKKILLTTQALPQKNISFKNKENKRHTAAIIGNNKIYPRLKILHLEDAPSDAELVHILLQRTNINYDILVVDSEADYIKALKTFIPDIILADHRLPAFDSLEALKIVKQTGKKIPFILVTGAVSEEYAVQVMREGADDYILKDRIQRLPNAILNVLEKYKLQADREIFLREIIISEADLALKNKQMVSYNQIVSHDLRTPVTSIMLIADIIDKIDDETERKKLFGALKKTAININDILNVLVDIATINEEAGSHSEHISLLEAFDKTYSLIEVIATQLHAKFITDFTQGPSIYYSKIFLESIFLNLISNSLKYRSPDRLPVINIISYKRKDRSFLEYTDNGLGLNIKKFGKQLFGLNQTFHQNNERKGLGLFMIKNQIEGKGGKIKAESKENEGMRFIIEFAASKNMLSPAMQA